MYVRAQCINVIICALNPAPKNLKNNAYRPVAYIHTYSFKRKCCHLRAKIVKLIGKLTDKHVTSIFIFKLILYIYFNEHTYIHMRSTIKVDELNNNNENQFNTSLYIVYT